MGVGGLGEDAGNLVPDTVLDFHLPADQIEELDRTVTAGYTAGLGDAGWMDPGSLTRLGMVATTAAKYAWIGPAMLRAVADNRAEVNGRPLDETFSYWAPTVSFLLDRADEARTLAEELGTT